MKSNLQQQNIENNRNIIERLWGFRGYLETLLEGSKSSKILAMGVLPSFRSLKSD